MPRLDVLLTVPVSTFLRRSLSSRKRLVSVSSSTRNRFLVEGVAVLVGIFLFSGVDYALRVKERD
jgi:hypothetical protein